MRSLADLYADDDVLILGRAKPVIGTAMLGDDFGIVRRATIVRTGEREEIRDDAQTLRMVLINNPGFQMTLECVFDATVTPPALLQEITLPYVGVIGRVMEGVTIIWEEGGERGLSIPVAQWDTMEDADAYRIKPDGTLETIPPPP